jgi:hypothetical protein
MACFTDKELEEIVNENLKININSQCWLDKLNYYFRTAKEEVFEKSAFKRIFDKKLKWKKYNHILREFKSKSEAIAFLKKAWNKEFDAEWELKCIIAKLTSSVAENIRHSKNYESGKTQEEIVKSIMSNTYCSEVWRTIKWTISNMEFFLTWRPKSLISKVAKSMWNPEYSSASKCLDDQWFHFTPTKEWASQKEIKELAEKVRNLFLSFGSKLRTLKTKWMKIHDEELESFQKNYEVVINDKKPWTSEYYGNELKFTLKYKWLGTECKFTPLENKNQNWINLHSIYSLLQKEIIWYITRHFGDRCITDKDLKLIAEHFFENLQNSLNKTKEKEWTSKEDYLLNELWPDMQDKLRGRDGKTLIQTDVKTKNRNLDNNIKRFLLPWLIEYFKTKLIEIVTPEWEIIFTSERSKVLIECGFPKEIRRKDVI